MFLSNLKWKSHTTNMIENNIFEGMTSIFLNIVSKRLKHNLKVHILHCIYDARWFKRENKYCSDIILRYIKICTYNF